MSTHSRLASLLERRRLRIAEGLALAPLLAQEMRCFRAFFTAGGNVRFAGATANDDLALSAMLACWLATVI